MNLASYLFSIAGILVCLYVTYSVIVRYLKIKDLPMEIIKESEKVNYLSILRKYATYCIIAILANGVVIILPILELRLIIGVISIIIICSVYSDLLDEIADFDTSKKDSDILLDYLKETKEDSKRKAKENKIKKVDSLTLSDEDYEKLNKKEDK